MSLTTSHIMSVVQESNYNLGHTSSSFSLQLASGVYFRVEYEVNTRGSAMGKYSAEIEQNKLSRIGKANLTLSNFMYGDTQSRLISVLKNEMVETKAGWKVMFVYGGEFDLSQQIAIGRGFPWKP